MIQDPPRTERRPGSPLGLHRVLEPAGVLPQAAWRLDADPAIWPDEVRVAVDRLNLDAASCRQLHAGPRFRDDFDMFSLQRFYLSIVNERGYRLPDGYVEFTPHVARIRAALSASPTPTVPCNNDLLAENFLDDGKRLWLIDYEYSGNNDPCFELGNIWSESDLDLDQLAELVRRYFGRPRPEMVARARLQGLMSKYGWTLWASIQDAAAEIDFDFWTWGMEKYERAASEFGNAGFDALLDLAASR